VRLSLALVILALAACSAAPEQVKITGNTMGTQYTVKLPGGAGDHDVAQLQQAIEGVFADENAQMSTWEPDSEISRFNASRSTDWQSVSAAFCAKIEQSLQLSAWTAGAFDITVAPLVNLWGFGPGGTIDQPPDDEAILTMLDTTGYENLHADCGRPAIRKDLADLMIDMSAIGKGYAADRAGELLTSLGFDSYLVEVGGELSVRGANAKGEPWAIGVEAPQHYERRPQTIIHLTDTGMATSGDYRNFFEADGKIYSHTIDPRTGRPVTHSLASVTVLHDAAYAADALATALLVMGPGDGMAFAEREELAVLMLIRSDSRIDEKASTAFTNSGEVT
jgi:thiamine biosynthesis lipoprotein